MTRIQFAMLSLSALLGLSACSSFDRNPRSGYGFDTYQATTGVDDLYQQRAQKQEFDAREELGYIGKPLTEDEQRDVESRLRLKRFESKLATKREKKQYYEIRSALRNDRERAYFLSLPTYEARERWAQGRGLGQSEETYPDDVAQTIESNDIALGMSQKAVMQSWGDPDAVEVAGNALYGFERWKYNRYVSGNEGYQKEMRLVYFEGGRVVGWERQ